MEDLLCNNLVNYIFMCIGVQEHLVSGVKVHYHQRYTDAEGIFVDRNLIEVNDLCEILVEDVGLFQDEDHQRVHAPKSENKKSDLLLINVIAAVDDQQRRSGNTETQASDDDLREPKCYCALA